MPSSDCPSRPHDPGWHDPSTRVTGDLDDDGHADVVERDTPANSHGKATAEQRIVWGGRDGSKDVTKLPDDVLLAASAGDFDGDGTPDLLTIAPPSYIQSADGPQPATILYGPLSRDGAPRTTQTFDVGYGGWATIVYTVVGDFDGDGRDDVVTKTEYDEEDARFEEEDMPEEVLDATFYRGTAEGLKPAGSAPGITSTAGAVPLDVADFDGDGKQDITAIGQGDSSDRAVAVYGSDKGPGRGKPRAGEVGNLTLGNGVAACDLNDDGYDDIAAKILGDDGRFRQAVVLGSTDGLNEDTIDRQ